MIGGSTLESRFTPATLSPLFWYKGDTGTVSSWTDNSGNGNHLLQATGSKQPVITSNALNGHSAYTFDGVDDFMQATFTWNQPCHIFSVHKLVTIGTINNNDFVWEGSSSTSIILIECSSGGNQTIFGAGTNLNYTAEVCTSSYKLHNILYSGVNSFFKLQKGILIAADAGAQAAGALTIGARFNGTRNTNVRFLEIVGFSSALSLANQALVEAYLSNRYSL